MIRSTKTESGFTLLELLISLAMIGVVVTVCLMAVRLATASREAGFQKNDQQQRLRVLHERLNSTLRSANLVMVPAVSQSLIPDDPDEASGKPKVLAFEGKPESLRLVTFSDPLMAGDSSPWMHEVRFYIEKNKDTGLFEILLTERNFSPQTFFSRDDSERESGQTLRIAQDAAYLKFRYYYKISEKGNSEVSVDEKPLKLGGKWADTILTEPIDFKSNIDGNTGQEADLESVKIPRAVEVSVGLRNPDPSEESQEPQTLALPPTVIPIQTGMVFERFEEAEETSGAPQK